MLPEQDANPSESLNMLQKLMSENPCVLEVTETCGGRQRKMTMDGRVPIADIDKMALKDLYDGVFLVVRTQVRAFALKWTCDDDWSVSVRMSESGSVCFVFGKDSECVEANGMWYPPLCKKRWIDEIPAYDDLVKRIKSVPPPPPPPPRLILVGQSLETTKQKLSEKYVDSPVIAKKMEQLKTAGKHDTTCLTFQFTVKECEMAVYFAMLLVEAKYPVSFYNHFYTCSDYHVSVITSEKREKEEAEKREFLGVESQQYEEIKRGMSIELVPPNHIYLHFPRNVSPRGCDDKLRAMCDFVARHYESYGTGLPRGV